MFLLELIASSFLDLRAGESEYRCKRGLVSTKALENRLLRGQSVLSFFFLVGVGGGGMMLLWERNKLG